MPEQSVVKMVQDNSLPELLNDCVPKQQLLPLKPRWCVYCVPSTHSAC